MAAGVCRAEALRHVSPQQRGGKQRGEMIPQPSPTHPSLLRESEHHTSNYDAEIKKASPPLLISQAPARIKMTADTLRCLHDYVVLHATCRCRSLCFPRNIERCEGEEWTDRSQTLMSCSSWLPQNDALRTHENKTVFNSLEEMLLCCCKLIT